MLDGCRKLNRNQSTLKNTSLSSLVPIPILRIFTFAVKSIENQIQSLWKLDGFDVPTHHYSEGEIYCNELIQKTIRRDLSGDSMSESH